MLGVSLDFLLREPQQVSSPPSFAVADSPPFAEDGSPGASGVPRGIDSSLNGMAPAVAVERVASCGQVPVAPFGRETDGLLGITKRSSAPLSGISERSSGLPETLSLESASPREPASPLRPARSDDSGFHGQAEIPTGPYGANCPSPSTVRGTSQKASRGPTTRARRS